MTDDAKTKAVQLIAQSVKDLVDGLTADEDVVTMGMCLMFGKRIAAQCTSHEDGNERVQQIARAIATAAATFVNAKLGDLSGPPLA
jgi:hypothetical protein